MKDYSTLWQAEWAEFDPAIQQNYAKAALKDAPIRGLPHRLRDLNYFDPNTPFFRFPFALMSASDITYKSRTPDMFKARDRHVVGYRAMLTDSGGYQLASKGMANWEGDKTRKTIMTWQQETSEYMLSLDLPIMATEKIDKKTKDPRYQGKPIITPITERLLAGVEPTDRLYDESGEFINLDDLCAQTGYARPEGTCLYHAMVSNTFYEKNRTPGASKILNIIQGRNDRESKIWFDMVSRFKFDGLSFASLHKNNLEYTIRRILEARDYMVRNDTDRIHFLGKAQMPHLCAYSTLQEQLRKDLGKPEFIVSADASSPFINAGKGGVYTGFTLGPTNWGIHTMKLNEAAFVGSTTPLLDHLAEVARLKGNLPPVDAGTKPDISAFGLTHRGDPRYAVQTEVGKVLTLGDICVRIAYSKKHGLLTTWDSRSYDLITNHNIQVIAESLARALTYYHADDRTMVPFELLALKEAIREVFKAENSEAALFKHRDTLNILNSL